MPYYKRYARTTQYRRKGYSRGYPRKGNGSMDLIKTARAAYSGVRYIKSLINVETKSIENTFQTSPTSLVPSISLLTGVAEGNDENTRNGRSVLAKSIYVQASSVMRLVTSAVRIMVVIDKANNGAVPFINNILVPPVGAATYITSPLNQDYAGSRFNVIVDKRFVLSPGNSTTKLTHFFRKLNHHLKYTGIGLSVDSTASGHLWLVVMSDQDTAANTPITTFTTRVMFTDN